MSVAEVLAVALREQALEWLVTLWSGEAKEATHAALQVWREQSPLHEQAWQEVLKLEQRLRSVPAGSAGKVLRSEQGVRARRNALRGLGALILGGGALHVVRESTQWQTATAAYSTARGERRELILGDGSRLVMNTATALDVVFDEAQRCIRLYTGEVFIETATEATAKYRPFFVQTSQGSARALGTRFTVRSDTDRVAVAVFEGAVEVSPRAMATPVRVNTGEQVRFSAASNAPVTLMGPQESNWVEGWTKGLLSVEQMRLGDFLTELGRYRSGVLRWDPAIADLPVSGSYPFQDTQRILDALAEALPIRVSYFTPYWVSVAPR